MTGVAEATADGTLNFLSVRVVARALTCETEPPPSVGAWIAVEIRHGRAEPPAS